MRSSSTQGGACPRSISTGPRPFRASSSWRDSPTSGRIDLEVFSKSADDYLEVHDLGADEADVTEGSGGVWERLHYDWSDPDHVVLTTTDSNVWGGASGYTYTLKRLPDGMTDVDVVIVREGKNAKGRVLGLVLGTVGKRVLGKAFTTASRRSRRAATGRRPTPSRSTVRAVDSILRGVAASALGTLAMDALLYRRYRHGGGDAAFPAWESSEGLVSWENAPATGARSEALPRGRART